MKGVNVYIYIYIFTPSAHILKLLHIARLHRRPGVTVTGRLKIAWKVVETWGLTSYK
jgi:hypothetical protein